MILLRETRAGSQISAACRGSRRIESKIAGREDREEEVQCLKEEINVLKANMKDKDTEQQEQEEGCHTCEVVEVS